MFTYANGFPIDFKAMTVCPEKPHCGKSGVPFMYSSTLFSASCCLILSFTSTGVSCL
jgi:hypothetical protein